MLRCVGKWEISLGWAHSYIKTFDISNAQWVGSDTWFIWVFAMGVTTQLGKGKSILSAQILGRWVFATDAPRRLVLEIPLGWGRSYIITQTAMQFRRITSDGVGCCDG